MLFSSSVRVRDGIRFIVWSVSSSAYVLILCTFHCHCQSHSTFCIVLLYAARNGVQMRYRSCANCVRTCENPNPECPVCKGGCGCPGNAPISHDNKCITLKMCTSLLFYIMFLRKCENRRPANGSDQEN